MPQPSADVQDDASVTDIRFECVLASPTAEVQSRDGVVSETVRAIVSLPLGA
jgi:hypothetical protein